MSKSSTFSSAPRTDRRRLFVLAAGIAALVVLVTAVVVAIWLTRADVPGVPATIYLSPAAAPVDVDSKISVSGLGWRSQEQVAICLLAGRDETCDELNALVIQQTADDGSFQASVAGGSQLLQGFTTVTALGLDSGRSATRTFRVLVAPERVDDSVVIYESASIQDLGQNPEDGSISMPLIVSGQDGWQGDYFDNPDLAGAPVLQRVESQLSMNWGNEAPAPELPADGFSARWTTRADFDGRRYAFSASADGGLRLYVDGQIIIDRWAPEPGRVIGALDLLPGDHIVVVEYFNASGPAFITVGWSESDDFPDWQGEYFANTELSGRPELMRNDSAVNFNWGRSGPAPGVLPADGFSARWTRSLDFADGMYRWVLTADDGARVKIDGQVLVDAWDGASGQEIITEAPVSAGRHVVQVEHRNAEGSGSIAVNWNLTFGDDTVASAQTPSQPADGQPSPTAEPAETPTPGENGEPAATPTDTPTVPPGSTATPTDVGGATSTPTATDVPGQTATPTPTNGSGGDSTPTPTATITPTPTETPEARVRLVDVNPSIAVPGTLIRLTTGDWTPGIRVTVAIVESGEPFSQAAEVPGTVRTTPANPAQGFTIEFTFPTDSRWQLGSEVWIFIHNSDWTEWGRGELELREE